MWAISGQQLPEDHPMLRDDVLAGIGSGGPGFNTYRPDELTFLITLTRDLKRRAASERQAIFADTMRSSNGSLLCPVKDFGNFGTCCDFSPSRIVSSECPPTGSAEPFSRGSISHHSGIRETGATSSLMMHCSNCGPISRKPILLSSWISTHQLSGIAGRRTKDQNR